MNHGKHLKYLSMKRRIAFDLDETLGTAITDSNSLIGFNIRNGCLELLEELDKHYQLILWTSSQRSYLDKILHFGLSQYFFETYSWDDISELWKDIRRIQVEYLIDDDSYQYDTALKNQLEQHYIIIPPYGCKEDNNDPLLWTKIIKDVLL
jgi:TFIIF-interacting CTD phosphatase-like protein